MALSGQCTTNHRLRSSKPSALAALHRCCRHGCCVNDSHREARGAPIPDRRGGAPAGKLAAGAAGPSTRRARPGDGSSRAELLAQLRGHNRVLLIAAAPSHPSLQAQQQKAQGGAGAAAAATLPARTARETALAYYTNYNQKNMGGSACGSAAGTTHMSHLNRTKPKDTRGTRGPQSHFPQARCWT